MKKASLNKISLGAVLVTCFVVLQAGISTTAPATKAELGKLLFFDPILSSDRTISCASCHLPQFAFADTAATSLGVHKSAGTRNTPSSMNLSLQIAFFWDGRSKTIEEQALIPIENPVEMNLPIAQAIARLQKSTKYKARSIGLTSKKYTIQYPPVPIWHKLLQPTNVPWKPVIPLLITGK